MPKRKTHALRCSILVPHAGRRFTRAYGDGCTKGAASTERRTRLKSFDRPNYGRSFLWALRNWTDAPEVWLSLAGTPHRQGESRAPPAKNIRSARAGLSPWGMGQERKSHAREKLATLPWGGETPPQESSAHVGKYDGLCKGWKLRLWALRARGKVRRSLSENRTAISLEASENRTAGPLAEARPKNGHTCSTNFVERPRPGSSSEKRTKPATASI